MKLAEASVDILGSDQDLQETLARAEKSLEATGKRMQAVGKSLFAKITLPLAAVGAASFKMASDAEESANKFDVVMGSAADAVRARLEELTATIPLTRYEMEDLAGSLQDMLVPMGVARQTAAGMSADFVELAGDIGSFNNVGTDDVLEAIKSALAGASEPMRRFGVDTRVARLEALAHAEGLLGLGEAMDQTAMAQAVLLAIQEDSTDAMGDAARTVDSTANSVRFLWRDIKDLGVQLGTILTPSITEVVHELRDMVGWVANLDPATIKAGVELAALAAVLGPLVLVTGALATAMGAVIATGLGAAAAVTATGAWLALIPAITGVADAVALLQIAIGPAGWVMLGLAAAAVGVAALTKAWVGANSEMSKAAGNMAAVVPTAESLGAGIADAEKRMRRFGDAAKAAGDTALGRHFQAQAEAARNEYVQLTGALQSLTKTEEHATDVAVDYDKSIANLTSRLKYANAVHNAFRADFEQMKAAVEAVKKSVDEYRASWQSVDDVTGQSDIDQKVERIVQAWAAMPPTAANALGALELIQDVFEATGSSIEDLLPLLQEYIDKITEAAKLKPPQDDVVGSGWLSGGLSSLAGGLGGPFGGILSAALGGGLEDATKAVLGQVGKLVSGLFSSASKAKEAARRMGEAHRDFLLSLDDLIAGLAPAFGSAIENVRNAVNDQLKAFDALDPLGAFRDLRLDPSWDPAQWVQYLEGVLGTLDEGSEAWREITRILEYANLAVEKATSSTEDLADNLRDVAAEAREFNQGLVLRALSTVGHGAEADAASRQLSQWAELKDAMERGFSQADLDLIHSIHDVENQAYALNQQFEEQVRAVEEAAAEQLAELERQTGIAQDALGVARDQLQGQAQLVDGIRTAVQSLGSFSDSLLLSDLSPLSGSDKLDSARAQFEAMANLAMGGDLSAAQSLPGAARALLEASRAFNASGLGFVQDFEDVTSTVAAVKEALQGRLTVEEQILRELQGQTAQLQQQVDQLEAQQTAIRQAANDQIATLQSAHSAEMDRLYSILKELIKQTALLDGIYFNDVPPEGDWEWDPVTKTWRRKGDKVADASSSYSIAADPFMGMAPDIGSVESALAQTQDEVLEHLGAGNRIAASGFVAIESRLEALEEEVRVSSDRTRLALEAIQV